MFPVQAPLSISQNARARFLTFVASFAGLGGAILDNKLARRRPEFFSFPGSDAAVAHALVPEIQRLPQDVRHRRHGARGFLRRSSWRAHTKLDGRWALRERERTRPSTSVLRIEMAPQAPRDSAQNPD
ncbi:hypothetical protein GGX14DRAFT_567177 [Mycena pura]|uniref:Uncharacterized protein n=1 Tax=Mycena pura TaxID=153505 RepID=A0AAD6VD09_9AGAR|nr:hypothetical protein GGX14DRAFT_567177 [Mycena pura]